ncbi:ABC transporter substrate-binding protein [Paenibacillus ginsengarvi]|uniref:Nitrate ABC transporter substrate-binding protein n=1 Tax=Paenibacillus ginsengarvi TaxID=400777 RepID=A0A3B0BX92_9BACL|nr:ABC transporter substrate-binding protein [Paenibacillus ginsengarvi]RKN76046.1 nitrate ABC transporter substrate-binding protein [Paenibacillus ginsengarvi]
MSIYRDRIGTFAKWGKKRGLALALVGAIVLLAATACGKADATKASAGGGGQAKPPSTLRIGYIGANKLNVPGGSEGWGFYKGLSQDELKKYGITDIQFIGFPNGPDLSEAIIGGRLDIGSLGDTPAILAKSTGAPTKVIHQNASGSNALILAKKGGPTTLADLKGKKVSVKKGSYMHRYLAGLLKKNNIKDVQLIHLLDDDADAALVRGEVDAIATTEIRALKMIPQGFPVLDEAAKNNPDLVGTGVTVVSESYLRKFPDIAKVWNELRVKALDDLKKQEEAYYAFLAENTGNPLDLVKKTSPVSQLPRETFTDAGIQMLEGTKSFLLEEKLADKNFSVSDWLIKP